MNGDGREIEYKVQVHNRIQKMSIRKGSLTSADGVNGDRRATTTMQYMAVVNHSISLANNFVL